MREAAAGFLFLFGPVFVRTEIKPQGSSFVMPFFRENRKTAAISCEICHNIFLFFRNRENDGTRPGLTDSAMRSYNVVIIHYILPGVKADISGSREERRQTG